MSFPLKQVIAAVRNHLDDEEINYVNQDNKFHFGMDLENSLSHIDMRIRCTSDYIVVHATAPLKANVDVRDAVMSFITYANYGLQRGNFEIDLNDGRISYKNFYDFGDSEPSPFEVFSVVSTPMMMMQRYGDGLINVMFNNADPQEACSACES